jgi:predicted aldo/keto reductase-like oxidoreductase
MLVNKAVFDRLSGLGLIEWIDRKKAEGKIINFGFSFHGVRGDFIEIIDAFDWDFCMIQYNYYDENNQAGREGLLHAASKGIPVMVMEPLRGGGLAGKLPKKALKVFESAPVSRTPAEWGLLWVWNHPEVTTVLSGMSTTEMLDENVRAASESTALTEPELDMFKAAKAAILESSLVPCTGCGYCMPCPAGVDIPMCFSAYNDSGKRDPTHLVRYIVQMGGHEASRCVKCGKCEGHCPQAIPIRDELSRAAKALEGWLLYKPVRAVVRRFLRL